MFCKNHPDHFFNHYHYRKRIAKHWAAEPTSVVDGWVGTGATEIEVVRVINIRISGTRPIVARVAHGPQGASIQVDTPATARLKVTPRTEQPNERTM